MISGIALLLFLTNIARYNVAPPLIDDPYLDNRAQVRAEYLCAHNEQHTHDGWETSFASTTYQFWGENLAWNFKTYGDANMALMHSPLHRKNILDPRFDHMGLGQSCGIEVELFAGDEL
jgi:uncharacterized protein YkwD